MKAKETVPAIKAFLSTELVQTLQQKASVIPKAKQGESLCKSRRKERRKKKL